MICRYHAICGEIGLSWTNDPHETKSKKEVSMLN